MCRVTSMAHAALYGSSYSYPLSLLLSSKTRCLLETSTNAARACLSQHRDVCALGVSGPPAQSVQPAGRPRPRTALEGPSTFGNAPKTFRKLRTDLYLAHQLS